jgi:hypothetical protein
MQKQNSTSMSPLASETSSSKPSAFMGKVKRIFRWFCIIALICAGIFIFWKYFYTYSEGYRAGLLQKFSHKGTIFKTYEGEMILSSVSSTNNVAIASEKFNFSVINKNIVREMDTIQGQTVIVHYLQKNSHVFWRGDSEYLVDSVKIKR